VKVLAKLGLVTAAAATVLFIFIYEIQGPVLNRVMAAPPSEDYTEAASEEVIQIASEPETIENGSSIDQLTSLDEAPVYLAPALDEPAIEQPAKALANTDIIEEKIERSNSRRIYGKITLSSSGEQLEGVNIMVSDSKVAKVSNATGGYTIQVPRNTRELVFIYRGKKLVQRIDSDNNLKGLLLTQAMKTPKAPQYFQ